MFFIFNRYDKRFLFKDQTLSMYDGGGGGGEEGGGRGLRVIWKGCLRGKKGG